MAIRPTRGSGIGQVSPFSVLDRSQDASSLLGAGVNPQTGGIGQAARLINQNNQILPPNFSLADLSPVPGSVGISQVPSTGAPDLSPSFITTDEPSIFDSIITPRGQESFGEALDILGGIFGVDSDGPFARREQSSESDRRAKNRDQILSDAAEVEAQADRDFANSILADAQRAGGQRTEEVLAAAEAQAAGGTGGTGGVGGTSGVGGDPRNEGPAAGGKPVAGTEDDPVKAATVTALDEYLKSARPGVSPEGYDQYIEEFQKATGLDVSGQPDKSTALMAFGLALMQNKAGKGFDVGAMLSSVGEAGEKALPALTAAKKEARAIRAKAGEYALGRKKEDQAAAMNREQYYLIPRTKTGGPLGVVEAVTSGKGRFERLNAYELNNLVTNEDFNREYDIVKADAYNSIVEEAMKAPEVKDKYLSTIKDVPLFTGAPSGLALNIQLPDRNASSDTKAAIVGGPDTALNYIKRMEQGLVTGEKFFEDLSGLIAQTDVSIPSQARSAIVQGLRNLGLNAGDSTDPVKQIQVMLTELKAKNAAEILGESGKTLSDNDRRMVSEIVGDISFTEGDEALLISKLDRLYKSVIGARRQEIDEAYNNLATYGINVERSAPTSGGGGFTLGDDGVYRRRK